MAIKTTHPSPRDRLLTKTSFPGIRATDGSPNEIIQQPKNHSYFS